MGAATLVETGIVLQRRLGSLATEALDHFLTEFGISVISFTEVHWAAGLDGWHRFGRGRHPARLNFGDCLTYATARISGEPLLCTGNDFLQTDLEIA